jgi:hypothetical protein
VSITTLDGYIAASKQRASWTKTGGRTTIAATYYSLFDVAGSPGAGALAGISTAAGVSPDDTTAGYPALNAFGGGATGYLSRLEYASSVACRILLFDRLMVAGAYAFNANTNLAGQPDYSGRCPGADFKGLELWVEQVTAATGNQAVNVTYLKEDNATSQSTGAVGVGAAPAIGRCWQLPLAAGNLGVAKITNVTGSVATVGTFNVMVLRRLASVRVPIANAGGVLDLAALGMPQVFSTSALYALVCADATAAGVPDLSIEVANG